MQKVNWLLLSNLAALLFLGLIGGAYALVDLKPEQMNALNNLATGLFGYLSKSALQPRGPDAG